MYYGKFPIILHLHRGYPPPQWVDSMFCMGKPKLPQAPESPLRIPGRIVGRLQWPGLKFMVFGIKIENEMDFCLCQ